MTQHLSPPSSERTAAAWHEIETLVNEIASLSRAEVGLHDFYVALLERAVSALAAVGGTIWLRDTRGQIFPEFHVGIPKAQLDSDACQRRKRLVSAVLHSGQPRVVPAQSHSRTHDAEANPTDHLLVLSPLRQASAIVGVVEVFQHPGGSPQARDNAAQVLFTFCELASDYHDQRELRELRSRDRTRNLWDRFVENIHSSLDVDATAYAIANDGRLVIGCDRVAVLEARAAHCRTLAISGVDIVDRRANLCRALEQLANSAVATGEEIWYSGDSTGLAPQVDACLQEYVDQSHARRLTVVPLRRPSGDSFDDASQPSVVGVLVAEEFGASQDDERIRANVLDVCRRATPALQNALLHQRMPLMSLSRFLQKAAGRARVRRYWLLTTLMAFAALSAALLLVPADFEVEARGELQPKVRREIFATTDGVVQRLLADHGFQVKSGDVVVELTQSDLDFSISRVAGELRTAQRELHSVRAKRWNSSTTEGAPDQESLLAAEQEQLRQRIAGLEEQREVLRQQQEELNVRSPIDGQVLTWNASQLLGDRPVRRGQKLLSVAEIAGPWVLETRVADKDIGHVLQAQNQLRPDLEVTFLLATDPSRTYAGRVEQVALATHSSDAHEPTVLVTVGINRREINALRPGASAIAKIRCGRRALGYVWLHDLFDTIRAQLMW